MIQLHPSLPSDKTLALLKMTAASKDVIGFVLDFGLESKIDSHNNKINSAY